MPAVLNDHAIADVRPLPMLYADTPPPPYVAVIFTSTRTEGDNGPPAPAAT